MGGSQAIPLNSLRIRHCDCALETQELVRFFSQESKTGFLDSGTQYPSKGKPGSNAFMCCNTSVS